MHDQGYERFALSSQARSTRGPGHSLACGTAAVCNCPVFNFSAQRLSQSSVEKSKVKIAPATQRTNVKVLISPKMPLKQNAVNLQQQLYNAVVRMAQISKESGEPEICIN